MIILQQQAPRGRCAERTCNILWRGASKMYKDMMDTIGMVNAADPELGAAMERELTRQRENIELIAS